MMAVVVRWWLWKGENGIVEALWLRERVYILYKKGGHLISAHLPADHATQKDPENHPVPALTS